MVERFAATDPHRLWLIGGGGHAMVITEAAELAGLRVAGYFDDREDIGMPGVPRLGSIRDALHRTAGLPLILAIGDLSVRARLIRQLGNSFCSVFHPTSIVARSACVGRGSYVGPGAVINTAAELGPHSIVNTRAVIEHDCRLGVNSHIGPGAILGGCVTVGRNTLVGINASVRPNIVIGDNCTIGAGATVVRDVPAGCVVVGIPARPLLTPTTWRRTG